MMRKLKVIALLSIAFYFGYKVYQIYFYIPKIDFKKLKLRTLDNQPFVFNHLHLQSSIIVFFQTWCGPCINEMKLIQQHYSEFRFASIYFISDEPIEKIASLKNRFQLDSLNFILSEQSLSSIGIQAFPTIYIIKNQEIKESHKGTFIDESNLEDEIFHLKKVMQ